MNAVDLSMAASTALLVFLTLLPLSKVSHWAVRGWDFPRLQLAVLAALNAALVACINPQFALVLVLASLAVLIYQLWWIAPYTKLWPKEVNQAALSEVAQDFSTLSVLTSNVLMTNSEPERLLKLVERYQPDVLVLLETNQWWQDKLSRIEHFMPYTHSCPQDNLYGMHVYSKLKLHHMTTQFLLKEDIPSMHGQVELANGHLIDLHFLHPMPPSPTEAKTSAKRDAELIVVAKQIEKSLAPVVVAGDLNDVAWSRTTRLFRKISGLLDPRVGRGMFNTFHANYFFMRWPLDHLFHSSHFELVTLKRLENIGSDHLPLYTKLKFLGQPNAEQQGLEPTKEDYKEAKQTLESEGVGL